MSLNDPLEARKYIEKHEGRKMVEFDRPALKVDQRKSTKVSHVEMANTLLKYINIVPGISTVGRKVMSMKIVNPGINMDQVAIALGLRVHECIAYERDAMERVKNYMRSLSVQEGINKFNTERLVENEVKNLNRATKGSNPIFTG